MLRGDRAVRMSVRYGLAGEKQIEIVEGAREGDEIVISNMTDYTGVKELRVK